MRTDQLVAILRECQIAYLTPCIDRVYPVPRETIPETDAPIGGAPTARQQPILVGTPCDGLDRCRVICEHMHWRSVLFDVPYQELVIIPAAGEHGAFVERPPKATYLLLVSTQPHLVWGV